MSEEEIIEKINYMINNWHRSVLEIRIEWIKGLLDLYNKEKQKNERLVDRTIKYDKTLEHLQRDTISKDKIKEVADDYESKGYIEIAGAMRELLEERN